MTSLPSRFQGIEIPPDNPFENDKLGYSQYATILKGMVDMYKETGCVISLNGRWGTGKTTFMQMWRAFLPQEEYNTVYFNAWETDYFSNPLTAILGELKEITQDRESFKKVCATLGKIAFAAGGSILKGVIHKGTGIDPDVIKDTIDEARDALQDSLDDYAEQKQSLSEFKVKLSEFVASQDGKTVVFIIDELDRCNPHYAVRVLEIVKHLFDVPNICFVLAIDKNQLECSIKGFYGSSEIDAENYLRRFIDIEFRMPEPDVEQFTSLLYDCYGFQDYFNNLDRRTGTEDQFKKFATALCKHFHLDLRTYDKILSHTRLAYEQLGNDSVLLEIILLLCFIRVTDSSFFSAISEHRYSVQNLLSEFENKLPKVFLVESETNYDNRGLPHLMAYTLVPLLMLYNCIDRQELEPLFKNLNKDSQIQLIGKYLDKDTILEVAIWFRRVADPHYGLGNVLKTVNLLRQFS